MRRLAVVRWLAFTGLVAALSGAIVQAPGYAASVTVTPVLTLELNTFDGTPPIIVTSWIRTTEQLVAHHLTYVFDGSNLAGVAELGTTPLEGTASCSAAAAVVTCTVSDPVALGAPGGGSLLLPIHMLPGAVIGMERAVTLTISADEFAPATMTAADTVDGNVAFSLLRAEQMPDVHAQPGGTFGFAPTVFDDKTSGPTHGAALQVIFQGHADALKPQEKYSNCRYDGDLLTWCLFTDDMQSAKSYVTAEPMRFALDSGLAVTDKITIYFVWWPFFDGVGSGTPGTGGVLHLVPYPQGVPLAPTQADYDAMKREPYREPLMNQTAFDVLLNSTTSPTASPAPVLPVTGTPIAIVATSGLALLIAGLVVFRMARRRSLTEV